MDEILQNLLKVFNKIKFFINTGYGAFWFAIENYRKRYPYVLLGENKQLVSSNNTDSILLYRITGKRYIFECSAIEICNAKDLISKFHPLDVRTISFIAGVDQILKVQEENRIEKFEKLKELIFDDKLRH